MTYTANERLAQILKQYGFKEVKGSVDLDDDRTPKKVRTFAHKKSRNRIHFVDESILIVVDDNVHFPEETSELNEMSLLSILVFFEADKRIRKYCRDWLNGILQLHQDYKTIYSLGEKADPGMRKKLIALFEKMKGEAEFISKAEAV